MNNRSLFLRVLDAGKPKIIAPTDSVSRERLLLVSQTVVFGLCSQVVENEKSGSKSATFMT